MAALEYARGVSLYAAAYKLMGAFSAGLIPVW